jgi:hypothetical protein
VGLETVQITTLGIFWRMFGAEHCYPYQSNDKRDSMIASSRMPEGPAKAAMMKEIGMANTAMSNGDMRSACKSFIRAQKIGSIKS